ncbi:UPF0481 protein At3g47200-like [Camellia sinensis]|uniref:UPF0481 protein At3g47200-like n=1 Tax=Camellia sinensis TaxID=4442 RepID=UPI0010369EDA|nr:UPF0481 protein At3g47200-like [Camellia sinensis]
MENGEHQAITIAESDSNQELPVRSTNEIEESTNVASIIHMQRRLNEIRREGIQNLKERQNAFICKVPQSLIEISSPRDIEREIVSIGPYHHSKDGVLEFESYKWQFLHSLLSRTNQPHDVHLRQAMKELEREARTWYTEPIEMSSEQFIEMMMLDGCFIIELFQQVSESEDSVNANSLLFRKTWLIQILIRDLLKLENQLPFFVLERLFNLSIGNTSDLLSLQALKFFNLALPRSLELLKNIKFHDLAKNHLLDLFHSSYLPCSISSCNSSNIQIRISPNLINLCTSSHGSQEYHPLSNQSMPCVTRLRLAGIKFRPQKKINGSFLDINFHKGVLEIPPITINDFTSTILINCVALEQCSPQGSSTYFSEYIAFMSCLISSGRDVTFLCDDGIITNFSYNDLQVAHLFRKLGEKVVFNIRGCYLSKQFREVEAYYSSNWATLRRTYFSSPWSTISVVSASALLALTAIQTITAILSYKVHHS